MKKLLLIILAISFYPFGCEAQECEPIYIENPEWEATTLAYEKTITELNLALSKKADTIYTDVEIMPKDLIDQITVSHCDSTKFTTWFHHGGISGYPHDISFNTKEYGFVRVHFKDSLTNEIKVQAQYKLKRTKNYVNAKTKYEFIE